MPQTSFQLDEGTAKAIEELKSVFGVSTSTGVIRRAVALARVAARLKDSSDDTVTIVSPDQTTTKVMLAG